MKKLIAITCLFSLVTLFVLNDAEAAFSSLMMGFANIPSAESAVLVLVGCLLSALSWK